MKDLFEYGHCDISEFEYQLWKLFDADIWEKIIPLPERFFPFLIVKHYPYSLSVLLKISDNIQSEVFRKAGLHGNSQDWELLTKRLIQQYIYDNSCYSPDIFRFDSDEDYFCVYSEDIEAVGRLTLVYLVSVCNDAEKLLYYLQHDEDTIDYDIY